MFICQSSQTNPSSQLPLWFNTTRGMSTQLEVYLLAKLADAAVVGLPKDPPERRASISSSVVSGNQPSNMSDQPYYCRTFQQQTTIDSRLRARTLRCGSSLARLEMQCLHQERNTTCVSSCLSSASAVGPGGGFRALATGVFSLFCTTGFADAVRCLLLNRSVASQVVQLVDHVSAPSFVALAPSQLSEDASRTYDDSHVSIRHTQLISMGSR